MNSGTRLEHFTLFFLSLVAAVWFFVQYPSQDPRSAIKINFNKQEIKEKALTKWADLGYSADDYKVSRILVVPRERLLDSLQLQRGRPKVTRMLTKNSPPNLKPFMWELVLEKKQRNRNQPATQTDRGSPNSNDDQDIRLQLDQQGQLTALINEMEQLPRKRVNRTALGSIISWSDSSRAPMMPAVSDSILSRMFYFDIQREHGSYGQYAPVNENKVKARLNQGIPFLQTENDAQALADYYLDQSSWDRSKMVRDTVFIKRVNTVNAANVRYTAAHNVLGQQLRLDVVVSPTGALLGLQATYNAASSGQTAPGHIWNAIVAILVFILGLITLVIFFYRMRARTIDTRSSLVIAVIMGLLIPAYVYLLSVTQLNPFGSSASWNDVLSLFIGMGITAAMASVAYFVLFAVSDSLTRQFLPQKLFSYDYILQGSVFNKPIGAVLLRSVGLAFVLSGIWTLILQAFPGGYFQISNVFLADTAAWSPLFLLVRNSWFSFGLLLLVFLVVGSWVYGQSKNRWITAGSTVIACGIIVPVMGDLGPAFYEFLIGACLGITLTIIYLKYDFLTLLLSHFLFLGLIGSTAGWILPHSPDIYVFICVLGLMAALAISGTLAIFLGKDERSLAEYVPGYVEELAQEQRIKQELQIAREVQQSFLPSKTPAVTGLDVAAVCQPAYETGGDYYDFIPLDDHRVALAIGDVSGKGIQAAFYMTLVKGMLHSLCRETDSPAEVLRKANRMFYDNAAKGTFISLIYGVVDLQKKTFTFARAGHNPILHMQVSSGKVEELQPTGLGLGLTKGEIFDNKITEIELSITEDDLFLLYTDGIVEALNAAHQFFGTDRLTAVIKKQKNKSASAIVSAISQKVVRFIGKAKQHDDMTLLAIRFNIDE